MILDFCFGHWALAIEHEEKNESIPSVEKKKNREEKGGIHLKNENIWPAEEEKNMEKEANIWRRQIFSPRRRRK